MKVWLGNPAAESSGGMYRVYQGLYNYLPKYGVEIVEQKEDADVINAHIGLWGDFPDKPLVVSSHGMLWKEHLWGRLGDKVNKECLNAYRQADVVTAPSHFAARAIARYTLADPVVAHHGIDTDLWVPAKETQNYVLWNKSRHDAANNPDEMNKLAELAQDTMFYATLGKETDNVYVFGNVSPDNMRDVVNQAGVYLALSKESGGPCFGVLEAMASAVPVLSWNFGGTAEVISHKETGYLAEPNNYEDLLEGLRYCQEHRARLGTNARFHVTQNFTWDHVIHNYIDAYEMALEHDNKTVSVIIPCYNLGRFLPGCLDSVIEQTYKDLEIIVIDDASTDSSWEIIQEYAERDRRIIPLRSATNQHVSASRNNGIKRSTGNLLLPLDADDRLLPNSIELLMDGLSRDKSTDIISGKLDIYHESALDGNPHRSGWPNTADPRLQLEGKNRLPYASLYKRKVWERVGGYRTRIRNGVEDADFWTRAFSYGYTAKILDVPILRYTHREVSLGKQNPGDDFWLSWFPWKYDTSPANTTQVENFNPPKVSVVIPVGPNHFKYLQGCIDSVLAQTEQDWEVIVINDTGNSWENEKFYGMGFVRFIDNDKNYGVAHARNQGVKAAQANKIVFLDVDDILQPHALQSLLAAHDYAGGWIYGDWYINKGDHNSEYSEAEDWNYNLILQRSLGPITGIYEKSHIEAVGGFTEDLPGWEDWDFHLKLLHIGACGTRLKTPLITYNMHLGQRREDNFSNRDNLLKYIREKHYDKLKGDNMACSRCGGKRTLVVNNTSTTLTDALHNMPLVTLAYQGTSLGRKRIASKVQKGVEYKFSTNSPLLHVFAEEVDRFLGMYLEDRVTPMFKRVEQADPENIVVTETPLISQDIPDNVTVPLTTLGLSERVNDLLSKNGFTTVQDIQHATDAELLAIKGVGDQRVEEIKAAINTWISS